MPGKNLGEGADGIAQGQDMYRVYKKSWDQSYPNPQRSTDHLTSFFFTVFTVATGNAIISLFLVTDRHHDSDMMGSLICSIGHGGLGCRSYSLLKQKNDKWRPVWGCCHYAPEGSRLRCTPLSFPSLGKGLAVCKEPLNVPGIS